MKKVFFLFLLAVLSIGGFAQCVIDPCLSEEMNRRNDDEKIDVIVIMNSQYDRAQLNRRADYFASRAERREFVVNELKTFAEASQYDLRNALAEMERNGMVTEPRILWMANALNFSADKAAIADLARRSDIALIGYDMEHNWIPENEAPRQAAGTREITPNVLQVNANQVWDLGYTGVGVVVAVIDTGVNYNHVDLADHLWDGGEEFPHHGYDVYNNDNDPIDDMGHGSHCAGTVCGDGTGGSQTGMAPDATLMCVKCLNANGGGGASPIAAGIQWAVEHGCDMFSMSLGIANSSVTERTLLRNMCVAALDAGVVAAIAAGNEGNSQGQYPIPNNVRVPGSCPPPYLDDYQNANPGELSCSVCVGAVDYNDNAAYFTSRGPVTWTNTSFGDYPYNPGIGLIRPDVCAPGVEIKSLNYANNYGYTNMSGTSMATPCVAGCMALLLSKNIDLTPEEVCRILEETAHPLAPGKSNIYGFGRVDVLAAIEEVHVGAMVVNNALVNDPLGNNDHKLNPGETVSLGLDLTNITEEAVNGARIELVTTDEHVTILNGTAQLPNFTPQQNMVVEDLFAISVDDEVTAKQKIKFCVEVYVDDELSGKQYFNVVVYDYQLQYGAIVVLNDDDDNGLLNPGETADLRVYVDNVGNEMAQALVGTLATDYGLVTLNEVEKPYGTVGAELSGYAEFNLTLDASAPDDFMVPFTLDLVDADGRLSTLTFTYKNACDVLFVLNDSYGDGWNNAYLAVEYSDGTPSEHMTINSGSSITYTRELASSSTVTMTWHSGNWDSECSFQVTYADGTVIFENQGGFTGTRTFDVNCAGGSGIPEFCASIENLTYVVDGHDVILSWDAPADANPVGYEVYRETVLLGTITGLGLTDADVEEGLYSYCVYAVYDDCQSEYVCEIVEVTSCTSVLNLDYTLNDDLQLTLTWEAPEATAGFVEYQVYMDDELMVSTQELSCAFTVTTGEHDVNVKAVFDECDKDAHILVCVVGAVENMHYVAAGNHADVVWDALEGASQYEVYLNGELAATVDETYFEAELANGLTTVAVKPVADGCYVIESSIEICYINSVENLQFVSMDDNGMLHFTWDAVENADYYSVTVNGTTEQVTDTEFAAMGEIGSNNICVTARSVYGCASEVACLSGITVCPPVDGFDYSFNGNEVTVTWNGEGIDHNEVVLDGESQIVNENRLVAQVENGTHTIKVTPTYYEECWATFSATFDFEVTNIAPEIQVTDVHEGWMTTAWNAVDGALAYNLYRDDEPIAEGLTELTYTDTEMAIDAVHCFAVQSVFANGVSDRSEAACANYFQGFGENEGLVKLFPNPTSDKVTVACAGMTQIALYSIDGRLVESMEVHDTCQIDLLESGVYVLRIVRGDEVLVRRIVKR